MTPVALDPDHLQLADVLAVARHHAPVEIPDATLERVRQARQAVEKLADHDRPVYGVSTGFGALAQRHIPTALRTQLQKSLIRSHAAGVGEPVEREVVRAMMLLRARTLPTGRTGVARDDCTPSVAMLNGALS